MLTKYDALCCRCAASAKKSRKKRLTQKIKDFRNEKASASTKADLEDLHLRATAYIEKMDAVTLKLDKTLVKGFKATLQKWAVDATQMPDVTPDSTDEDEAEVGKPLKPRAPKRQGPVLESAGLKKPQNQGVEPVDMLAELREERLLLQRERAYQAQSRGVASAASPVSQVKAMIRGAGEITNELLMHGFVSKTLNMDEAIAMVHKAQFKHY